jgi:hypothetical protein
MSLAAGASDADGVVTRWEAATCHFTLHGDEWDPWGGPYAGILGPQVGVRVLARKVGGTWAPVFTGTTTADGWVWNPGTRPTAVVSASDPVQLLAAADGPEQAAVGQGEIASARVTRILDAASFPVQLRNVTSGGVTVKSTTLANAAWPDLLQVADTDLALLWISRDGRLSYIPQGRVGEGTKLAARLVMCPPEPPDPTRVQYVTLGGAQPTVVRNIVSVSRQKNDGDPDPLTVTVRDDASAARYLPRPYQRTDLIHTADAWSTTVANAILAAGSWPSMAPRDVVLNSRVSLDAVPLLFGLEPSHTFDVEDPHGQVWREGVSGWDVTVSTREISGTVVLDDISRWVSGKWDTGIWDESRWGVAVLAGGLE